MFDDDSVVAAGVPLVALGGCGERSCENKKNQLHQTITFSKRTTMRCCLGVAWITPRGFSDRIALGLLERSASAGRRGMTCVSIA